MTERWREMLAARFGHEIVAKCCRLHKGHYNGGRWGYCGSCGERPVMTPMTWEEADEWMASAGVDRDV